MFQDVSNAVLVQDGQTFGYSTLSKQGIVTCVRLRTQLTTFEELKFKKSKSQKLKVCYLPYIMCERYL